MSSIASIQAPPLLASNGDAIVADVTAITAQTLTYLPSALAAVQAVELTSPTAPGTQKIQAAVNGILAGTQALEATPIPAVSAIAALVNMAVSILNAFGIFTHKPKPVVLVPVITSPLTDIASMLAPYTYQIVATNTPTAFGARGLPPGLVLDVGTGLVSGTPTGQTGYYPITLSASNAAGIATTSLSLTVVA